MTYQTKPWWMASPGAHLERAWAGHGFRRHILLGLPLADPWNATQKWQRHRRLSFCGRSSSSSHKHAGGDVDSQGLRIIVVTLSHLPPKKLNPLRFSPPRALPRPARFRPYKYPGSPFAPSSRSPRCQFLRDPPQSSPFISLRSGGTMASVGSLSASPLLALTFVEQSVQGRSGSTNYSQGQRCLNRERDAVLWVRLSCDTVLRVSFTDRTASLKHFPTESYQPTSRLTSP